MICLVTVLVDAYGTGTLNKDALDALCPIIRKALAASASVAETQLIGCDLKVIGNSSGKRWIEQSGNTTHLEMSSTLTSPDSQTSGVSALILSFTAFVVSAFALLV